jgi:hypothetical protein
MNLFKRGHTIEEAVCYKKESYFWIEGGGSLEELKQEIG